MDTSIDIGGAVLYNCAVVRLKQALFGHVASGFFGRTIYFEQIHQAIRRNHLVGWLSDLDGYQGTN